MIEWISFELSKVEAPDAFPSPDERISSGGSSFDFHYAISQCIMAASCMTPRILRALRAGDAGMFVPTTFHAALLMTVLSTICWGSFANTFKGTKNYRFELYYRDYGLGIFLISVVLALTMGSYAGGPTAFLANLRAADGINLFYAALGGFIFNIANTLLVAGIEMVGLAIAFPVSIGIALVEGVVLSYALQPRGNPVLLGAGVFMAVVAVVLVGKAYGALRTEGSVVSRRGV